MSGQETMDFFAPMSAEEEKAKIKAMRDGEPMAREGMYWSEEEDEAVLFKFYALFSFFLEKMPMSVSTIVIAKLAEAASAAVNNKIGALHHRKAPIFIFYRTDSG